MAPLKKVYRKRLVRSLLVLLPLMVIAGALLYIKIRGFKEALEQLVDAESSGQYALIIDKSSIDVSDLSFTFNDLTIQRDSAAQGNGIVAVHIPFLQIRFGSIASMLMLEQFDIQSCIIQEPVFEIDAAAKFGITSKEGITLSQQIVQLYPAVQALLGRFDIQSLKVTRATVDMNKTKGNSLRLNLIDLLVEEWNIEYLNDSSQLQLNVGGQDLDFGKAALKFSGIEYNFREHHLLFSDFNFLSQDTISDSRVRVSGKSLVLEDLDYRDLYENKRYSIKKAQIDRPEVTVHFRLKKRDTTKVNDRAMMTRLLKNTIGECSVDSTIIRDARVHIVAQQGNDSVSVDLPRVNFRARAFKVLRDSSTFQIGEIEIDLNRTAIELRKDLSLHCDRIFFDRYQDLALTNVMLFDSLKHDVIATCERFSLSDFNLLSFIFFKNLSANAIRLEKAHIQFTPDWEPRVTDRKRKRALNNIAIRNVSLKDVTVHYRDEERSISLDNLSMVMYNFRRHGLGEIQYTIQSIRLPRATHVSSIAGEIQSQIRSLTFSGRSLSVQEIDLKKDSLDVHIRDFKAEKFGDEPIQKSYKHWKVAHVGSAKITGSLEGTGGAKVGWRRGDFDIDTLKINHLELALKNKGMQLTSTGENFILQKLGLTAEGLKHGDISGNFINAVMTSRLMKVRVGNAALRYPAGIRAKDVDILENNLVIKIPAASVDIIEQKNDHWFLKKISATRISIANGEKKIIGTDSITLADVRIPSLSEPTVARLEIYKPEILFAHANEAFANGPDSKRTILPDHIILHPGILYLENNKQIAFGKIHHDSEKQIFTCGFIQSKTEKMHYRLNDISVTPDWFRIDSLRLWPNEKWFNVNGWEDDLINANLYGLHFSNFSIEHLLKKKTIENADATLDHFVLNVTRDKRRIDPPEKEKPTTLGGLLKLPAEVGINSIQLKNGQIRYTETSETTGANGVVLLEGISAFVEFDTTFFGGPKTVKAKAKLYNTGPVDLHYNVIDSTAFKLYVDVRDFDLTKLNDIVVPLQSLQIKSGHLKHYNLVVTADSEKATGQATITYKGLHLEIFKRTDPEKKTLGSGLLTLLADGIILKHSKTNAVAPVDQPRIKHKSIFNYWVKSAVHGAMGAIRKGKSNKVRKPA